MYSPGPLNDNSLEALRDFVLEELQRLSNVLFAMQVQQIQLTELHVAIAKPREGMVVFADGTDWNPGSGRGVYVYSSSAWVKL